MTKQHFSDFLRRHHSLGAQRTGTKKIIHNFSPSPEFFHPQILVAGQRGHYISFSGFGF